VIIGRRVYRPTHAGTALVRRPAPGDPSQGESLTPEREPDARLDHLSELLPHVPQARRQTERPTRRRTNSTRYTGWKWSWFRAHADDPRRPQRSGFSHPREKYKAIIGDIRTATTRVSRAGRYTVDRESELISGMLEKDKLPHQVLNRKQHAREAETSRRPGAQGSTIATNMAGLERTSFWRQRREADRPRAGQGRSRRCGEETG